MVEHLTQLLKEQIELMRAAAEVLGDGHPKTWTELMAACTAARTTPDSTPARKTVEGWIQQMKKTGAVSLTFGAYKLKQP